MHDLGTLMANTILLTGATGMVGQALGPRLARRPDVEVLFALVHKSECLLPPEKMIPVLGDVTAGPDLGLAEKASREVLNRTTIVVHAAADTGFSSSLDKARATNIDGTKNVLSFSSRCPRLKAFIALSTVHVAGRRTGTIFENELSHDTGFVNSYEQSKYETELSLREHMDRLPISVLRLSTVLGSSKSGEVARLGAIHHALRLYYNSLAPMIPGTPDSAVDLIDMDYAVAAIERFSMDEFVAGRTFQICGGQDVLPIADLLELTYRAFLRYRPSWRKRMIEMPAIVDLPTFELFARSVEEIGDSILMSSVATIRHFAPQLAFPKTFVDAGCRDVLCRAGISKPRLRDFYPNVVRWLVETGWGEHKLEAEMTRR
jgi:nucleoside-diphosphate-sugar epimerase